MTDPTPEAFRRAVSRYATGIAIVTTTWQGHDHAMTANSFASVSLDPVMALVCVQRDTRFHEAILGSGTWAVGFLPEGSQGTARWFATRGRPLDSQLEPFPHHRGGNGAVLLDAMLSGLELATEQVIRAGDHDVVIGRVTDVHLPTSEASPTVYFASRYRSLAP